MMKTIEQRLCSMHQRRYSHLVGNGTSGLALCLQALGLKNLSIGIPESVCINVPLSVFFSGNQPSFLDISLDDLCLAPEELAARASSLHAVIAVHGYGSVCRIAEIEDTAARHGLPVIEDACLAQGGQVGNRPVGSFGIASVVSFGSGKPISLGHGGAILTDDLELYREIQAIDKRLPGFTAKAEQAIDELSAAHTRLYNGHYGRDLAEHVEPFRQKALAAKQFFLHRFNDALSSQLSAALEMLSQEIDLRWANWTLLSQALISALGDRVQILTPPPGSVPWRLNLLTYCRDEVMRALHGQGLHASSWHPPVSEFFGNSGMVYSHVVAERIGKEILNLWITEPFDNYYVIAVTETLNTVLKGVIDETIL